MLSLVFLFLVLLLASAIAVWMHRKSPAILDFMCDLFSKSDSAAGSTGGLQQFISSVSTPGPNTSNFKGGKVRNVKLRSPRSGDQVPWGW